MVDVKIVEERHARRRRLLEERARYLARTEPKPQSLEMLEFEVTYSKTWSEIRRARSLEDARYWAKRRADVLTAEVVSVEPFLPSPSHSPEEVPVIPALEKHENARWLALLIDAEGTLGWTRYPVRIDRIDERYRYEYVYRTPHIGVGMDEIESRGTVERGAELIGVDTYTDKHPVTGKEARRFTVRHGRALSAMRYMEPYLVKFRRLANLCLTLFKHHTLIPIKKFDKVIEMLFGRYVHSKKANRRLLRMSEAEFRGFMKRAEELTDIYLK